MKADRVPMPLERGDRLLNTEANTRPLDANGVTAASAAERGDEECAENHQTGAPRVRIPPVGGCEDER